MKGWRQFRAKRSETVATRDITDVALRARRELNQALTHALGNGRHHIDQLEPVIDALRRRTARFDNEHTSETEQAAVWLALMIAQGPRAARAQQAMDKHPHSYHTQQGRLYELIDFNDAFVSTALVLDREEQAGFIDIARHEIARFCHEVGGRMFSDEQFEAITRGLSREVAVYNGAKLAGYEVSMTSRSQDALGVDMVITDTQSGKSLNVDCKTSSAYRYRLQDLVREGRISEKVAQQADIDGFVSELNGHDRSAVEVTLLRIDPNELGDITDFSFDEPRLLKLRLERIFRTVK